MTAWLGALLTAGITTASKSRIFASGGANSHSEVETLGDLESIVLGSESRGAHNVERRLETSASARESRGCQARGVILKIGVCRSQNARGRGVRVLAGTVLGA